MPATSPSLGADHCGVHSGGYARGPLWRSRYLAFMLEFGGRRLVGVPAASPSLGADRCGVRSGGRAALHSASDVGDWTLLPASLRLLGLRGRQRIWRAAPSTRPPPGAPCAHPGGLRLEAAQNKCFSDTFREIGTDRQASPASDGDSPHRQLASLRPAAAEGDRGVSGPQPARGGRAADRGWIRRLPKAAGRCLAPTRVWVNPRSENLKPQSARVRTRGSRRRSCRRPRTPDSLAGPET
jgi:hypothetical protein